MVRMSVRSGSDGVEMDSGREMLGLWRIRSTNLPAEGAPGGENGVRVIWAGGVRGACPNLAAAGIEGGFLPPRSALAFVGAPGGILGTFMIWNGGVVGGFP